MNKKQQKKKTPKFHNIWIIQINISKFWRKNKNADQQDYENDKYGFISYVGKEILTCVHDKIIPCDNGIIVQFKDKDGLIVDLRSNPGGLLTNAIYIADMFLDQKVIVSTVDRDGYKNTQFSYPQISTKQPVVVLINGGSASASEILSGALKDNNRAIIVGKKSFGKGLVQEINKLPDGSAMHITIQKYLTPNGTDIHKKGIAPDYVVDITEEDISI